VTRKQRRALERYLTYLRERLDLREWAICLHDGADDVEAKVCPTYGQRHACLYLSEHFWKKRPAEQAQTLVHELLHLHTAGIQHHAEHEQVLNVMGRPAHATWYAGFEQLLENAVDAIATAFARRLDPIDWDDKRRYRR
jgi:hypothetical protein